MTDVIYVEGRPCVVRGDWPTLDRRPGERWESAALCEWVCRNWGWHPNVWFPPDSRVSKDARHIAAAAASVCAHCTVAIECDAWADRHDIRHGVWAGRWIDAKATRFD